MKFCKARALQYSRDNKTYTTSYVTAQDVLDFHGEKFTDEWKRMLARAKVKPFSQDDVKEGFYYSDYKHTARMAQSYLHPHDY